jgi:hypothetical protein
MLVFHNSNSLYEKPTHENIIKNRQNHVNGVLGLWFAVNPKWIDSFGRNTYEITLDQNDVIVLPVDELFQWEKTANFLNNNKLIENKELEKEKYYLNLRESLLKQGTKAIIFEENNNNKEMGIILDLKIIKKFQLIKNNEIKIEKKNKNML